MTQTQLELVDCYKIMKDYEKYPLHLREDFRKDIEIDNLIKFIKGDKTNFAMFSNFYIVF